MKFYLKLLAAATCALLAAAPLTAAADETATEEITEEATSPTTEDGLYKYKDNGDGTVMIIDFVPTSEYEGALTIPSEIDGMKVTYIGNGAFVNANNVTSIIIPATVDSMGECVFMQCTSLEEFIVEEGNPYFSTTEDGVLLADGDAFLYAYPAAKAADSYTVPEGVDEIAPGCFSHAELKAVILPEGVYGVDAWAFAYADVESVQLPDSLRYIDDYAFAYCRSLREVDLGNGLTEIWNASFACCVALQEITFPDTLTTIGQSAFLGTSLPSVTIPASVTEISYHAFGYDTNFKQIESFTVYGESGSAAESYCSYVDTENDYENSFTFVSIAGTDSTETQPAEQTTNAQGETIAPADESKSDSTEHTGITKEALLRGVLIGAAAVAVILVGVLAALVFGKKKASAPEEADEKSTEQDEEA